MDSKLIELYDLAVENDIELYEFDCIDRAMIIKTENTYAIALDMLSIENETTEKEALAHELGHYFTNAMYDFETPLANVGKYEQRADIWAINRLIPKKQYLAAKKWAHNMYELAEELGVSEDLVIKADHLYCAV